MSKHNDFLETVEDVFKGAMQHGIWQLSTDVPHIDNNGPIDGRLLKLKTFDQPLINFGNCSYLGLETDERLKKGAIDAILKHGTQVSSSRAYLSSGLYDMLEEKFHQIFDAHIVIAPTTTLGHLSTIPVVIDNNDAVILDQFVHASVQRAVILEKTRGVKVDLLRHNRLDRLEEQIKVLRQKHDRIWYMIDGVYSMYGQLAPMKGLHALLEKYEQFYLYVDDAHGMGWAGQFGRGYALEQISLHRKMIMSTSLAKAFGTTGGVMIFPEKEMAERVRTVGYPMIFSGPLVPAVLGASLASADIMLSNELPPMQADLVSRIEYGNQLIVEKKLPYVELSNSPIFFICLGHPRVGYNISKRLMADGFYTNLAIFPAVPVKNTGLRLTFTLHTTKEDIKNLLDAVEYHLPKALAEEGKSLEDIYKAFKLEYTGITQKKQSALISKNKFSIKIFDSIHEVDKALWDKHFSGKGSFTWDALEMLENTFKNNTLQENNWKMRYYQIFDSNNKLVLMTFFSLALTKEDMLAPVRVSSQIEEQRKSDPYYLCAMYYSMGSPLTDGEHLFIDRDHRQWKEAVRALLEQAGRDRVTFKAETLLLRDFEKNDNELKNIFIQEGFFPYDMPDNHILDISDWDTPEQYYKNLSSNKKQYIRKNIRKHANSFEIETFSNLDDEEIKNLYGLYRNVKAKSLEFNTFIIPLSFFQNILSVEGWEVTTVKLKPELGTTSYQNILSFGLSFHTGDTYCQLIVGTDYKYLEEFEPYRQMVYQSILRAKKLECSKVFLAYTASIEKQRFGAKVIPTTLYADSEDSYASGKMAIM